MLCFVSQTLQFDCLLSQSRVGPVQWLKPYTDEVLVELGQKGVKSLLAVPVRYAIISLDCFSFMCCSIMYEPRVTSFGLSSGILPAF